MTRVSDGDTIVDIRDHEIATVRFPNGRGEDEQVLIEYDDRNAWLPYSLFENAMGSEFRLPDNVPDDAI